MASSCSMISSHPTVAIATFGICICHLRETAYRWFKFRRTKRFLRSPPMNTTCFISQPSLEATFRIFDSDDSLVAVSVTGDLQLGQPRRLFTSAEAGSDLSLDALSYVYDVGPKAERFVVVQMPTGGKIAVVQNWPEGFRAAK